MPVGEGQRVLVVTGYSDAPFSTCERPDYLSSENLFLVPPALGLNHQHIDRRVGVPCTEKYAKKPNPALVIGATRRLDFMAVPV